MQRTSQINETNSSIGKIGEEYEQNWANSSHTWNYTQLLIIGKDVQPHSQ